MKTTDFLVVGVGLAGLSFANDTQASGATVQLLDKSRGVGGRMATRRIDEVRVDHGAQYFTAKGERLQRFAEAALADGWLSIWSQGFPLWENGRIHSREPGHARYAPLAGMNEVAKRLAEGLSVETNATVTRIEYSNNLYTATTEDGRTFSGETLILNLPPAQLLTLARPLLTAPLIEAISRVVFLPAWAMILRLATDIVDADWPAIEFKGHPVLGWVARDHTKRGPHAPPVLVVHGSGEWSQAHLEDSPETVQAMLREATESVFGSLMVNTIQTHRWRYALPTQIVEQPFLWEAERSIGICGDWCGGPRVEGAIESGWQLANFLSKKSR